MRLVRRDVDRVAGRDLVHVGPEEHPRTAAEDDDPVVVRVLLERRLAGRRNLEVANRKVRRPLVRADQHRATAPLACPATAVRLDADALPGKGAVLTDLPVHDPHGPASHEVRDGPAVQVGDPLRHLPLKPHLQEAPDPRIVHLLIQLVNALAAPGELGRGGPAAREHRHRLLHEGTGSRRVPEERRPGLGRPVQLVDQRRVVLQMVGEMGHAVPHVPALVLAGQLEDQRRDGIGGDVLEELEQFHERALPQQVEQERRVGEIVLAEQALQRPLGGRRDVLQTAAVGEGALREHFDVPGLVLDLAREEHHHLAEARIHFRQQLRGQVQGQVLVLNHERADLADGLLHLRRERRELVPRDRRRGVPLPQLRLFDQVGDVVAPHLDPLVHREVERRRVRIDDRAALGQPPVRGSLGRHLARLADETVPQIDPVAFPGLDADAPVRFPPGLGVGELHIHLD